MNLLKWLTLGLAGSSLANFATSAPIPNNGNYNPCYPANLNAGGRAKQYGTSLLVYQDAETANECHPGEQGVRYYICPQPIKRSCGRMNIENLDKTSRSESNVNNPCLDVTAKAGKDGFFANREELSNCPPSPNEDDKFPVQEGGFIKLCPISKNKSCKGDSKDSRKDQKPHTQTTTQKNKTTKKNKIDPNRYFGNIG